MNTKLIKWAKRLVGIYIPAEIKPNTFDVLNENVDPAFEDNILLRLKAICFATIPYDSKHTGGFNTNYTTNKEAWEYFHKTEMLSEKDLDIYSHRYLKSYSELPLVKIPDSWAHKVSGYLLDIVGCYKEIPFVVQTITVKSIKELEELYLLPHEGLGPVGTRFLLHSIKESEIPTFGPNDFAPRKPDPNAGNKIFTVKFAVIDEINKKQVLSPRAAVSEGINPEAEPMGYCYKVGIASPRFHILALALRASCSLAKTGEEFCPLAELGLARFSLYQDYYFGESKYIWFTVSDIGKFKQYLTDIGDGEELFKFEASLTIT